MKTEQKAVANMSFICLYF